jgi:hypothetical protein
MLWRWAGALALIAMVGGAWSWWTMRHWMPPRTTYGVQGVEIGQGDGDIDWTAVKAIGADFAYVDASASAFARDPNVVHNLDGARAAGLQVGAVHRYDPASPPTSRPPISSPWCRATPRCCPRRGARRCGRQLPGQGQRRRRGQRADDLHQPDRDSHRQARDPQDRFRFRGALSCRARARPQSVGRG